MIEKWVDFEAKKIGENLCESGVKKKGLHHRLTQIKKWVKYVASPCYYPFRN